MNDRLPASSILPLAASSGAEWAARRTTTEAIRRTRTTTRTGPIKPTDTTTAAKTSEWRREERNAHSSHRSHLTPTQEVMVRQGHQAILTKDESEDGRTPPPTPLPSGAVRRRECSHPVSGPRLSATARPSHRRSAAARRSAWISGAWSPAASSARASSSSSRHACHFCWPHASPASRRRETARSADVSGGGA
jgi:hypothetical protein